MISADYDTITELVGHDGAKTTVNGNVIKNGTYKDGNAVHQWFEYYMSPDKIREFRFICSPDTFRYCNKEALISFEKVF